MSVGIKSVDYTVDSNDLVISSLELMRKVWPDWAKDNLNYKVFTEGITNKLIACYTDWPKDTVMVRVYGDNTDIIIDRTKEKYNMLILHKVGLCPPLYFSFNNGICYGFVDGVTLDAETICLPTVQRCVAREMTAIHSVPRGVIESVTGVSENGPAVPCLPRQLRHFLNIIPTTFDDPLKQSRLENKIPSRSEISTEVDRILRHLQLIDSPITFNHCDILCKNIIYSTSDDKASFIDYEYGDNNYQLYDIGNHFCEYAGVEEVDYTRYPSKEVQIRFLRYYLTSWFERHSPSRLVSEQDLEVLYNIVNKYALGSHLMWGLWALIQAQHSSIDFDYLGYAVQRFDEYFQRRDEFLTLPIDNENNPLLSHL